MASVGIIGAGIAGLTAAFQLREQGLDVTVFEASAHVGGKIRSERADGYLIEHGPNTVQKSTPLMDALIDHLGLDDAVVETSEVAQKRYVVRDGSPHPLPTSPLQFLTTNLFSLTAKLRLLREPFVRRAASDAEESVADFTRRRLGREILDYGLNPFVAGVFAGDPEQLSLRHAFERLYELEQEHGSLLKGLIRSMRARKQASPEEASPPARRMFSFRDGLQRLPDALAETLGDSIHRRTPVTAVKPEGARWIVTVHREGAAPTTRAFDAVISTIPLYRFAALDLDTALDLSPLADVTYPPVSVVALGLRRNDVAHPLDGFGMLVPEVERDYRILGTIFSSTLFPDRAPKDHVLLTTFLGGDRDSDLGRASFEEQRATVLSDLRALLGVRGEPTFIRRVAWPRAIPQYTLGYGRVKALIDRLERAHPGLFLAGNYRDGISIGDAMASGDRAAQHLAEALGKGDWEKG